MSFIAPTKTDSFPADLPRPDYDGNSIVNLMSSISTGRGADTGTHKPLQRLDDLSLQRYRNILLVLVDGLGYEYLRREWPDSSIAEHLRGTLTSVFPTTTAAAITTIMTGLTPAEHGLTGWHVWLREIGTLTAVLPFRSRTGYESLEVRGLDPASVLDARPIYPRLEVASHVISPSRISHSPFNLAFSAGAKIHSYNRLDQFYQAMTDVITADTAEKYVYAYWPELDHIGHQYGMGSKKARHYFKQLDKGFSRLLRDLKNTDTLVLLTADHGFVDTTPATQISIDDHPTLIAMLDIPLCGEPRAAYCYLHAGEQRAFANYVETELGDNIHAIPSAAVIESGLYGPGNPHPRLHERVGDYMLLMKDNYIIRDRLPGESPMTLVGVHGGLTHDELYVPLVVAET